MPKYEVEISHLLRFVTTVVVEADNQDDALTAASLIYETDEYEQLSENADDDESFVKEGEHFVKKLVPDSKEADFKFSDEYKLEYVGKPIRKAPRYCPSRQTDAALLFKPMYSVECITCGAKVNTPCFGEEPR